MKPLSDALAEMRAQLEIDKTLEEYEATIKATRAETERLVREAASIEKKTPPPRQPNHLDRFGPGDFIGQVVAHHLHAHGESSAPTPEPAPDVEPTDPIGRTILNALRRRGGIG